MQTYNVFYLDGDDTATLSFDAENLDDLFEILRKDEIECILIYDSNGNEVFREKGFMEYTTKSNPFFRQCIKKVKQTVKHTITTQYYSFI